VAQSRVRFGRHPVRLLAPEIEPTEPVGLAPECPRAVGQRVDLVNGQISGLISARTRVSLSVLMRNARR
jgi:hypothetical protein